MREHFREHGDEFLLSPAAVLVLTADALHAPDTPPAGKARAKRVIEVVMQAARAAMFEQADILETMLMNGPVTARLLPTCDDLVKRIGSEFVVQAVRQVLGARPLGDAE